MIALRVYSSDFHHKNCVHIYISIRNFFLVLYLYTYLRLSRLLKLLDNDFFFYSGVCWWVWVYIFMKLCMTVCVLMLLLTFSVVVQTCFFYEFVMC